MDVTARRAGRVSGCFFAAIASAHTAITAPMAYTDNENEKREFGDEDDGVMRECVYQPSMLELYERRVFEVVLPFRMDVGIDAILRNETTTHQRPLIVHQTSLCMSYIQ